LAPLQQGRLQAQLLLAFLGLEKKLLAKREWILKQRQEGQFPLLGKQVWQTF
jgi:hypothetical protein